MKEENMDELNFNSQICTTREQSERLLALGLKKETADMLIMSYSTEQDIIALPWSETGGWTRDNSIPAWSLHRLIEIIFNSLKDTDDEDEIYFIRQKNPYEAILEVFEWLIKEEDFKKEYLEE